MIGYLEIIKICAISLLWVYLAGRLWTSGALTSIDIHYYKKQKQEEQKDGKKKKV